MSFPECAQFVLASAFASRFCSNEKKRSIASPPHRNDKKETFRILFVLLEGHCTSWLLTLLDGCFQAQLSWTWVGTKSQENTRRCLILDSESGPFSFLQPITVFNESQLVCQMEVDGVNCISEKKNSNEETWSRASSGHLRRTSNLWLLTFLPFLFQTILGWGSPAAWHTKEATPPWTPVWSSGVRVNLGDAVWRERQKSSHFFCVCVAPLWPRCCSEATATLQISIHTPVYECFNK